MKYEIQETWQVKVEERYYEAQFNEIIEWINEGALLPEDLVKHGNLRWLEAGKVPVLHRHFIECENNPVINQPEITHEIYTNFQVKTTDAERGELPPVRRDFGSKPKENPGENGNDAPENEHCFIHPDNQPLYYCGICMNYFCKECPNTFGSVKLCPLCGGLCEILSQTFNIHITHGAINKPYKRVTVSQKENEKAEEPGLTLKDLFNSFLFPFKFLASFGVSFIIFAAIGLGICGFFLEKPILLIPAISSLILFVILQFGEFFKTVESSCQNKPKIGFLPHLNKYSIIEDFVHPFFMGITVYLISFSLFCLLLFSTFVLVNLKITNQLVVTESEIRQKNSEITAKLSEMDTKKTTLSKNSPNIDEMLKRGKENQLNTILGSNFLGDNAGLTKLISGFFRLSIYLQLPLFLTFIVGILYFPLACAVAGSNRSAKKILNFYNGWKAVKKLGFDYIKILSLFLFSILFLKVVTAGVFIGFSIFQMPLIGLFTAIGSGALFLSYFWIVFSKFLGTAVSNKLNGEKDLTPI